MARTQIKSHQLKDGGVKREDMNTSNSGKAVITKVVAGSGISIQSTGADAGTGDVTVDVEFTSDHSMGGNKLTNVGAPTNSSDAANKTYVDSLVGSQERFDDDGSDLMPVAADSDFIFEFDDNGDLQPTTDGTIDTDFELDGNQDIQPVVI